MFMTDIAGEEIRFPVPRDRACPFDPPRELNRIRDEEGIVKVRTHDDQAAWLVSRYDHVRALSSDERVSADPGRPGYPERSASFAATMGNDRALRTLDNPEHDRQKRMIIKDFAVKRVEAMRGEIQKTVDSFLDQLVERGPGAELVEDFAFPVPVAVVCKLIGVPPSDYEFFGSRVTVVHSLTVSAEEAVAAADDLRSYIDELIDLKQKEPGDDLVSRLAQEQLNTGGLDRRQVVEITRQMVLAGFDTTANGIALSVVALLQHPEALQELLAHIDEPGVLVNAIDELMRYLSLTHAGRRRAVTERIEIDGKVLAPGDGLIIANHLADRDPSVFPNPERLDLRRSNARANVAFGYGIHQCPGQALSRVELQVVHSRLWRRLPGLRLAVPFEELRFRESDLVYGLYALPVTWGE
ncbi:MAG: hypothetical protein QOG10_7032 [Kribbellaceae bacterium]|jgi:cytochrome P450|nr:hypothetical protein [Kribbellaceae bacterium]